MPILKGTATKNSVDEPSKVTIKFEGRPPCRCFPTDSILVQICSFIFNMLKVCLLYIKQPNTQIKTCLTTHTISIFQYCAKRTIKAWIEMDKNLHSISYEVAASYLTTCSLNFVYLVPVVLFDVPVAAYAVLAGG